MGYESIFLIYSLTYWYICTNLVLIDVILIGGNVTTVAEWSAGSDSETARKREEV